LFQGSQSRHLHGCHYHRRNLRILDQLMNPEPRLCSLNKAPPALHGVSTNVSAPSLKLRAALTALCGPPDHAAMLAV
jgi:hypothetical protein